MGREKQIRLVKRHQKTYEPPTPDAGQPPAPNTEREARSVVSGWVREHQRRSEEFRRNYSALLGKFGFNAPWAGGNDLAAPALATNE